MKLFLVKIFPIIFFFILTLAFFKPVIVDHKLPIPADTIVGMYHPWRDYYAKDYPNGIPFKNFLITDPVRQQYVWRYLALDQLKNNHLPLWNPYNFSGTPLLANFQSAVFYPLNIFLFILPFNVGWTILVMLQPLLAGLFLYQYLRNLKMSEWASFLGAITFSFSGFSIAWLEWNTIVHVGLWLPLILLSIDKIFQSKNKNLVIWSSLLILSLISSFFAGHLQIFFYVAVFSLLYLILRWWQNGKSRKMSFLFCFLFFLFCLITAIQWYPTLQFINQSGRELDQLNWQQSGWFIPWQNLIQFLVPDFFGNPATLNYWGEWNYGEFIGYIGVIPLVFALLAIFYRRDKKTLFFGGMAIVSLVFALPTVLAKLPYQWHLPLISTSQPTRLLFLADFSLAVLAALGLDWFFKNLNTGNFKKIMGVVLPLMAVFMGLWLIVSSGPSLFKNVSVDNLMVAKRNLIFPTMLFLFFLFLVVLYDILIYRIRSKGFEKLAGKFFLAGISILVIFDLIRFGLKFTSFTKEEWLFPQTKVISFLQEQTKPFRFMTTDRKIFPPNVATFYRLEDVAGYDPLYLKSYGELVAAWQRGKPDISPFSFNRILTPQDYSSRISDLLNVTYVLSLKNEISPKLKLVFQEGQTRVYKNISAYPRAYLVYDYKTTSRPEEAISFLFDQNINLLKTAILEEKPTIETSGEDESGRVDIVTYEPGKVILKTKSQKPAILVLGDTFYSSWRALIDGKLNKIFRVDFVLRGIIVPEGEHQIFFSPTL